MRLLVFLFFASSLLSVSCAPEDSAGSGLLGCESDEDCAPGFFCARSTTHRRLCVEGGADAQDDVFTDAAEVVDAEPPPADTLLPPPDTAGGADTREYFDCGEQLCLRGVDCCDGACVDMASDAMHCGGCGLTCVEGEACVDGACRCGQTEASCASSQVCCQGTCTAPGSPLCPCGSAICSQDEICCPDGAGDERCVDPTNDPRNCGGCGDIDAAFFCDDQFECRPDPDAETSGIPGVCVLVCAEGQVACVLDGNSACYDPLTSLRFCGAALPVPGMEASTGQCSSPDAGDPNYSGVYCWGGWRCDGGVCVER